MDQEPLLPGLIATLSEAGLLKVQPRIEAHARAAFFDQRTLAATQADKLLIEAMFAILKASRSGHDTEHLKPLLAALEVLV